MWKHSVFSTDKIKALIVSTNTETCILWLLNGTDMRGKFYWLFTHRAITDDNTLKENDNQTVKTYVCNKKVSSQQGCKYIDVK